MSDLDQQVLSELRSEFAAFRQSINTFNDTLQEQGRTVAKLGDLALRTESELQKFKFAAQVVAWVCGGFLTIILGIGGYYLNERDKAILTVAEIANKNLAALEAGRERDVRILDELAHQRSSDSQIFKALTEAFVTLRRNTEKLDDRIERERRR